jgi:predicted nucleotidyltransferase
VFGVLVNEEILKIRDKILETVPAERIYLFGSYAYGTPNEDSDYDFYVVLPDGYEKRPIEAIQSIYRSVRRMERKPMDVLANVQSRFDDRKQFNTLERKIFREGALLYERI